MDLSSLTSREVLWWLAGKVKKKDFEWLCVFVWGQWGNRNAGIHSLKIRDVDQLLAWVSGLLVEFQSSATVLTSPGQPSPLSLPQTISWSPPPSGLLNLNSDVSVRKSCDVVDLGGVIRDSNGWVVAAFSKALKCCVSANVGEFLGLKEGLLLAKKLCLSVAFAEVDATFVVADLNLLQPSLGVAGLIISDIQALCLEVGIQKCLAIARSGSSLAHNLASLAVSSGSDFLWQDVCPSVLLSLRD
ncbi:hypothetical protein ACOSQ4_014223 [Xanthoceras sorbifolium]